MAEVFQGVSTTWEYVFISKDVETDIEGFESMILFDAVSS
jgi:hypothetical protein